MPEDDDRPTCATCPYWNSDDAEHDPPRDGLCQRHAPRPPPHPWDAAWVHHPFADYILTLADDFCGEHPDFPTYIRERSRAERK